jgi:hypothetical protein
VSRHSASRWHRRRACMQRARPRPLAAFRLEAVTVTCRVWPSSHGSGSPIDSARDPLRSS